MSAGPPASRPRVGAGGLASYTWVAGGNRANVPFTFKLSKRLARIKASVLATRLPAISPAGQVPTAPAVLQTPDRKSTRLNSSHVAISYAVFCLKKKNKKITVLSQ